MFSSMGVGGLDRDLNGSCRGQMGKKPRPNRQSTGLQSTRGKLTMVRADWTSELEPRLVQSHSAPSGRLVALLTGGAGGCNGWAESECVCVCACFLFLLLVSLLFFLFSVSCFFQSTELLYWSRHLVDVRSLQHPPTASSFTVPRGFWTLKMQARSWQDQLRLEKGLRGMGSKARLRQPKSKRPEVTVVVKTNGIPIWLVVEFTTHFRLPILVVGLVDVHWG